MQADFTDNLTFCDDPETQLAKLPINHKPLLTNQNKTVSQS